MRRNGLAGVTDKLAGLIGTTLRSAVGLAGLNDGLGGLTRVPCVFFARLQSSWKKARLVYKGRPGFSHFLVK